MDIKEMPLEERHDKLLDEHVLDAAVNYAIHKEMGAEDKARNLFLQVNKKMMPSMVGIAFKMLKAISPGTAFKQAVNQFLYWGQTFHPLSTLEVTELSDREFVLRINNCVLLKKSRDLVKKAGLNIDPKFICEFDKDVLPETLKEYGFDVSWDLEENGCRIAAKLK